MSIACTFPGKFGDLLWALPTVRAISETFDEKVTLLLSNYLAPILPLLQGQPYLQDAISLGDWSIEMTAPVSPRIPPVIHYGGFDRVYHLGYDGWPMNALPVDTYLRAVAQTNHALERLDLIRPWIKLPDQDNRKRYSPRIVVGFTDEWFELKYGICQLLERSGYLLGYTFPEGSRWATEGDWNDDSHDTAWRSTDWMKTAHLVKDARVVLACCSAVHVLSAAMGQPTVVMEPNPHRHNPIFWPELSRIVPVIGGDGKLTHDARHVRETLQKFL